MVVAILYQKVNHLSLPLRYYLRNMVYFCRKPVPMSTIPRDPLGLGRQKAPPPKNPAVCSLRSSRLKSTALRLYPFRLVLCRKLLGRTRCVLGGHVVPFCVHLWCPRPRAYGMLFLFVYITIYIINIYIWPTKT